MSINVGRVRAIYYKEFREYRRTGTIIATMAAIPIGVAAFPLILVLSLSASAAASLHGDPLIILLGIPALVPSTIASYAVVGERTQGSLEPVLTTAIPGSELLLAKALAAFVPSVVISYAIYTVFVVITKVLAQPGVAAVVLHWPNLLVQVLFTPLLAIFSIWIGIAVSARTSDVRVAQQLGSLASLPALLVAYLVSFNVIPESFPVALAFGLALIVADVLGWRLVTALFDRDRLITSTR